MPPYFLISWFMDNYYEQFNAAHKRIAKALGFDPSKFSSRSSRIGGACALALAGVPDSDLMLRGRWKFLAFLYYVRMCIRK